MRVLFASMPFDGHFNPLTGLAVHLKERGYDVGWYCGPTYAQRLASLGVQHFPFQRARDVNSDNLITLFPEYEKLGAGPKAIEFATTQVFFANIDAHYQDIRDVHASFPFDAFIHDGAFYAAHVVAQKLQPRSYLVAPAPSPAPTSPSGAIPPPFFGLRPARSVFGRVRDRFIDTFLLHGSMKKARVMLNNVLVREGLAPWTGSIWDLPIAQTRAWFQTGVASMDFPRPDPPAKLEFVGAMLPHKKNASSSSSSSSSSATLAIVDEKRAKLPAHAAVIVVSQGTIDNRDPEKLMAPTLAAFAGRTDTIVVATTGGRNTDALRARFSQHDNVVIADYVDFDQLMSRASVFVSNGGYGSVMHAFAHGLPVVAAGKLEGKNDICARIDYCGLGVDLGTERPKPAAISAAVARVVDDPTIRANVARVRAELASKNAADIIGRRLVADGVVPAAKERVA